MRIRHPGKLVLLGVTALWLSFSPVPAQAGLDVHVGIGLPPLIVFPSPPVTVILPGTDVYAVPDVGVDIFFTDGWWWRPWKGRWYRSRYYDRDWAYYPEAPGFYRHVPRKWRSDYRHRQWQGKPWRYHRIPHQQVEKRWQGWQKDRYWEKQHNWGVQKERQYRDRDDRDRGRGRGDDRRGRGDDGRGRGDDGRGRGNR